MTVATLTCAAPPVFPAPANREATLADLEHSVTERRAEAVVWVANRGTMADQPLLLKRLRDESAFVRAYAEQGLWLLWSRSGDAAIDRQMARGVEEMQTGRLPEALATFSDVIRQRPAFAEGWNKRATAHYMASNFKQSLADCDEVLKRNPNHFGAISGYGQIHFQMEDYEQALRWWRRALEVNPNMVGVETNIKMTEERLRQTRGRST
ncbi:MAG: tetratricopeptide repeat protein [Proteobacteria bacterium]|nr:tetratricopeptide repeat protein [Pseudomonadota bacterium]